MTVYSAEIMSLASEFAELQLKGFTTLSIRVPPQQETRNDCGICLCLNMEFLARVKSIKQLTIYAYNASAVNMDTIRGQIRQEIKAKKLSIAYYLDSTDQNQNDIDYDWQY